jgi:Ca2+-binding EF-hand superfamily protein
MSITDLANFTSSGEQLTDAEVAACLKECCEEEDEDGFIKYARKD